MQVPGENVKGYRFGAFEVDLVAREIQKNGRKIKLQDQPFRVLALLLQRYPQLVTREELRNQLWDEDTFVEFDHGLSNAISRIRDTLGDSADKAAFIETLPKRGYRFIVPVEAIENGVPPHAKTDKAVAPEATIHSLPAAAASDGLAHAPAVDEKTKAAVDSNSKLWARLAVGIALVAALGLILAARALFEPPPTAAQYKQLTSFENEVFSPALSPDGRMVAFIRGSDTVFPNYGEVYVKLLPDGDPVQLTNDRLLKYGVSFSPDGTQITYTALDPSHHNWVTNSVSPLGGSPRLFLSNAAGLTWMDDHHVLFGETKSGIHLGLVTSTDERSQLRDIYLPAHERGMAHDGWISPNRKWVLVVEMGPTGEWLPCRLVPFDGSSAGQQVGPLERCTSAAWSPDGNWMYFSAGPVGSSHIWREAFPKGPVQEITSGPTDESGVVLLPDGRSLITAIGVRDSGIWMTDPHGDRLLFSHGYESFPSFSRDGRSLYFLRRDSPDSTNELWMLDIASGKSEPIVQGFAIKTYSVSADGKEIVFSAGPQGVPSQIWITSRDRSSAPKMLTSAGEDRPLFAADGYIVFRASEGGSNYIFRMKHDGTGRTKVFPGAIVDFYTVSPDGRWVVAFALVSNETLPTAVEAVPLESGPTRQICPGSCAVGWSPDGARLYVEQSFDGPIEAVVMPVPKGESFPKFLPATGVRSADDFRSMAGASVIDLSRIDPNRCGCNLAPGLEGGTFAYVKTVVHRNLFEVPLP